MLQRRAALRPFWRFMDRHGWMLVATTAGVAFVAGFLGWTQVSSPAEPLTVTTRLYLTLQLFMLDAGAIPPPTPVGIELARFLAPLSLAGATIGTLVAIVQRNNAALRARLMDDHLIVVGLGAAGQRIAERAVDPDRPAARDVVVVEADANNAHVPAARRLGIAVIIGDGRDPETLAAAGVARARRLIAVAGEAAVNAGVAQTVLAMQAAGEFRRDFDSFIEIDDVAAMHELQGLVEHERLVRRQDFFNLADRAGAAILQNRDLFGDVGHDQAPPPVVVAGTTPTAASVLLGAARQWALRCWDGAHSGQLQLWLLARDPDEAAAVAARVCTAQPDIVLADGAADGDLQAHAAVLHVAILPEDCDHPALTAMAGELWQSSPSLVVVAEEVAARQLRIATLLRRSVADPTVPVVATAPARHSLVGLLAGPGDATSAPHGVEVFAVADELCAEDRIGSSRIDTIARALHAGYRRHLETQSSAESGRRPADVAWTDLDPTYRKANADAAHALWGMLARHGYVAVPISANQPGVDRFPDAVVRAMAVEEHQRYIRSSSSSKGRPPTWDDMSAREREFSAEQVTRIPASLRVAGLAVVPRRVGGLRANADAADADTFPQSTRTS